MLGVIPPADNYTLEGVSCNEAALNGVVARVYLERFNFDEYLATKKNNIVGSVKTRGRKKIIEEVSEDTEEDCVQSPEQRIVKRRGRRKKFDSEGSVESEETGKESNGQFAGKKHHNRKGVDVYLTKRIRKPNSRLSDFVISKDKRPYKQADRSHSAQNMEEEKVEQQKVDAQPSETTEETTVANDPLDISNTDDVVHSFLPVFDDSTPQLNDVLILKSNNDSDVDQPSTSANGDSIKENHNKDESQPEDAKNEKEDSSLDKADSKPPTATTTVKSPKVIPNTVLKRKRGRPPNPYKNRFNQPKKPRVIEVEKEIQDFLGDEQQTDSESGNDSIPKRKENSTYILVHSEPSHAKSKQAKAIEVDFNKLVRSLKMVKLPAANWKIRIVVSRQQTITEVTFTNKEENERCVKFSRTLSGYVLTFGNSNVKLLGAPQKISSYNDITVLLSIIHNIDSNDPVLEYDS